MVSSLTTFHADKRLRQRGLKVEVLMLILEHGVPRYGAGAVWYTLDEKELPPELESLPDVEKARHWVVALHPITNKVLTAYPNDNPHAHIRMKCRKCRRPWQRRGRGQYDDLVIPAFESNQDDELFRMRKDPGV